MADKQTAVSVVRRQTGLTQEESAQLVDAVLAGVADEALDMIAGAGAVPSTMADARAARLQFVTRRLKRAPRRREVEVIFRVPSSTARSILSRMLATYPEVVAEAQLLAAIRAGANPRTGDKGRYLVHFDDEGSYSAAYLLLNQRGLTQDVRMNESGLTIDVPRRMGPRKSVNPLTVLGIADKLP